MDKIMLNNIYTVFRYTPDSSKWVRSCVNHYTIAYQLNGNIEHIYKNRSYMLKEDSIIFISNDDSYEANIKELGSCIAIHFTLNEPLNWHFFIYDGKNIPHIKANFVQILNAWNRKDDYSWCDCSSIFYNILSKILRNINQEEAYINRKNYQNIVDARDYISINYNVNSLSIDNIARMAGLSRRRFTELFKSLYNITPSRYITHLRIISAQEMLRSYSCSIAGISTSVGYNSVSYFCRVFTAEVGCSPTQWIKQNRKW